MTFINVSSYRFVNLDNLQTLRAQFLVLCQKQGLKGTVLLAEEGINLNLAGELDSIEALRVFCDADPRLALMVFKKSESDNQPFQKLKVRIRPEIITFAQPDIKPSKHTVTHIKPETLKKWLDEGKSFELLDVRNAFEVEYGTFNTAKHVNINKFTELPDACDSQYDSRQRQKPMVMFCTGGVRCEKAGPALEALGFEEVYQLDGGILNYFQQCQGAHFQGDCFVFDDRIAVKPDLTPV